MIVYLTTRGHRFTMRMYLDSWGRPLADRTVPLTYGDGLAADELLVTEFCDTADGAGIYRKFSAFIVGDRVVPRHVFFSRRWMLKVPDLVTDALVAEERTYVETNPHEHELRAIFDLAGLEWGRIDYGVRDGALQIWEINTNPQL